MVQSRRSVRGFRNEPVQRSVIEAIIESAKREVARIPEDEVIMICVAMGYPDETFAANAVRSDREHNDEFVRFVGFAE
nr:MULTISPECIES: hypothetical protein [unclassified Bradyrhizobium]